MRKNYILFLIGLFQCSLVLSQVGINTMTPNSTLDVVGDVRTDSNLYLENPGDNTQIRNSKLLIQTSTSDIIKYDIDVSKYGPINNAEFIFQDLSSNGLFEYDTKISTTDYIVTLQGYYFEEAGTGNPEVIILSNHSTVNIEGYQIYAFENGATGTWCLKAVPNDSVFRVYDFSVGSYVDTPIDLYLNVIIYRKGFISKVQTSISKNMLNSNTGTVALPPGF
ncbi:hypothetical protein POV27_10910 [Aureisphaera galaxeae]|uniref:hypothetical protein n=1 Tax=Aureisphaera galaxeae TaxID=1538023 RepID=UPI0023503A6D|nr:hypothetical protein [Aureisphaera galaxeae]MDC8004559.1 hypothetical protein [Aureisphaera galaxeae]